MSRLDAAPAILGALLPVLLAWPTLGQEGEPPSDEGDLARLAREHAARREAYLERSASGPGAGSVEVQTARLLTGTGEVRPGPIEAACSFLDARRDTADFRANDLLRLLRVADETGGLDPALRRRVRASLLGFRYGIDAPGDDGMVFWTENHRILFATARYLAGTRWPEATFPNAGTTGAEHARAARRTIRRWLDERLRHGFSEWLSPVYYPHDLTALLNLVDGAPDAGIRRRAAMVCDRLLLDVARGTFGGVLATTAGRVYEEYKRTPAGAGIADLCHLVWGTGEGFRHRGATGALDLASSTYRVPHAVLGIGRRLPPRSVDRSRHSIGLDEGPAEGRGFETLEDGLYWWGRGAYVAPETIRLSRRMVEAWGVRTEPRAAFDLLRAIPGPLLPCLAELLSPFTRGSVLSRADVYVFRTPDAVLSSVVDYRPGQVGYQQHAWQATLGPEAVCFTTAPGTLGRSGPGPWTGSSSLPRVVQVEDVACVLYAPGLLQRLAFPARTHAWLPRDAFDEVIERGRWTFAREGDGYLGLFSARPTRWADEGRELVAEGARNAWVCVVGRRDEDGSFDTFRSRLASVDVEASGLARPSGPGPRIAVEAPDLGRLEVPWEGAPRLDERPVPTGPFPRYDAPWARQAFGDPVLEVRFAGATLRHDARRGTRTGDGL